MVNESTVTGVNSSVTNPNDSTLVPLTINVPRGALDVLAFRYYPLAIAENDRALAETTIEEIVCGHLKQEFAYWMARKREGESMEDTRKNS